MRLLIITQIVDKNDPVLGFFHRWLEEFSKFADLEVICLKEGLHDLPGNVRIHSLGKESGASRLAYLWRFYSYIWKLRRDYDAVFVHMNPEYVLLAGPLWKMWGKRVALWYVHRSTDLKLRIAARIVDDVYTASKESFRLALPHVHIMGHGIDLSSFTAVRRTDSPDTIKIITTGRISKSKRLLEMLSGLEELHRRGREFEFTAIGGPVQDEDVEYERRMQERIAELPFRDHVHYLGPVSHDEIPEHLSCSTVFLNLSSTGSIDKAVLEAGAAGLAIVTSNEAFQNVVPAHLFVRELSPSSIADAIEKASVEDGQAMRDYVRANHDLSVLIGKLVDAMHI